MCTYHLLHHLPRRHRRRHDRVRGDHDGRARARRRRDRGLRRRMRQKSLLGTVSPKGSRDYPIRDGLRPVIRYQPACQPTSARTVVPIGVY